MKILSEMIAIDAWVYSYRRFYNDELPKMLPAAAVVDRARRGKRHFSGHGRSLHKSHCPKCGGGCIIQPVNISRCTQVGGNWKTIKICSNFDCNYTKLQE